MGEEKLYRHTVRRIRLLFAIFSIVAMAAGIIAYNLAAVELKKQLVNKCHALAATVAAVIAEDSDGYAAFLKDMNTDTDYYRKSKALMLKLKQANIDHITYIYTEIRADDNTMMYVLSGEDPYSLVYTAPGMKGAMTEAERTAYLERRTVLGPRFVEFEYGVRLSAYEPIIHKGTGEFLGLVGVDITRPQYNNIIRIFIVQTVVSIITALIVFALCMWWLSGSVHYIEEERSNYYDQSTIDDLTQLKNRRDFIQTFQKRLSHYRSSEDWICIAIVDIDFFKKYNDHYGHLQGDECLRAIGKVLNSLKDNMGIYAARVGGEEFALIWYEKEVSHISNTISQIQQMINELKIPHEKSKVAAHITVSVGIHTLRCGTSDDMHTLYDLADKALYTAKRSGRNRVVIYGMRS